MITAVLCQLEIDNHPTWSFLAIFIFFKTILINKLDWRNIIKKYNQYNYYTLSHERKVPFNSCRLCVTNPPAGQRSARLGRNYLPSCPPGPTRISDSKFHQTGPNLLNFYWSTGFGLIACRLNPGLDRRTLLCTLYYYQGITRVNDLLTSM